MSQPALTRYDTVSIAFHWLTALLVGVLFLLAEVWEMVPRDYHRAMIVAHMSLGIILAAVVVARIVWRILVGRRVEPAAAGLLDLAARGMHYLLYGLLILQVVLGFVLRWSEGRDMSFFGWLISPPFAAFSKPAHHLVGELHNIAGWTIIVLALGHAAAGLYHHFVVRDDVLRRMLLRGGDDRARAA